MREASEASYQELAKREVDAELKRIVDLDLPRTFANNRLFSQDSKVETPYTDMLRSMLYALSHYRADIKYCQGFNYIAALLLLVHSVVRGRDRITVFRKEISQDTGHRAVALTFIATSFVLAVTYQAIVLLIQKAFNIREMIQVATEGIKSVVSAILILSLAYCINAISKTLGTSNYVISVTENWMTPVTLLALAFAVCAFMSFFTGTSCKIKPIRMHSTAVAKNGIHGSPYRTDTSSGSSRKPASTHST